MSVSRTGGNQDFNTEFVTPLDGAVKLISQSTANMELLQPSEMGKITRKKDSCRGGQIEMTNLPILGLLEHGTLAV